MACAQQIEDGHHTLGLMLHEVTNLKGSCCLPQQGSEALDWEVVQQAVDT